MHSYIPAYLRSKNRGVVLQLLSEHKVLSKADIVKYSNLSFPTVTKVVADFLQLGLVYEAETVSTSENGLGRKGQLLRLNENAFSTVGIFFEGNRLHVGLVNLSHTVIDQIYYPLQQDPSTPEEYERISSKMTGAISTLRHTHPETKILGVGIGMPGAVDSTNMTFRRLGKLHYFYDSYRTFSAHSELPTFIENDINAASLGEMILRDNLTYSNLFYLSLGTGIGAGIIINNHIWHGNANFAGDFGMALNRLTLDPEPSDLTLLRVNNQINIHAIMERFHVDIQHNLPCTLEQKKEISEYMIRCFLPILYNLNYILDISHYVLSGSITEYLSPTIFDCINEHLDKLRRIDMIPMEVEIIPSIDRDVGIVGVAEIALEKCLPDLLA